VTDPWFSSWRDAQQRHIAEVEDGFAPLPVLRADLAPSELVGTDRLLAFANHLYAEADPLAMLHDGAAITIERKGDVSTLSMPLPFCDHDELDVGRRDDELLVRVGPYRRAVHLPDSLKRRDVKSAELRDGRLEVAFLSS
jgi:arsenite-transporting ATPase